MSALTCNERRSKMYGISVGVGALVGGGGGLLLVLITSRGEGSDRELAEDVLMPVIGGALMGGFAGGLAAKMSWRICNDGSFECPEDA